MRVVAVLAALLLGTGSVSAVAAEPVPVGTPGRLDGAAVTVTVQAVTIVGDEVSSVITGLADEDLQPGDAGVVVRLVVTNDTAGAFKPKVALDYQLVDAAGREHHTPASVGSCGDRAATWVWYGHVRPGSTARLDVCFTAPAAQLDGATLEVVWTEAGEPWTVFALAPAPAVSPVASPVTA